MQAPRAWLKELTDFFVGIGYEPPLCEACIYIKRVDKDNEIVAIYVYDLVLVAKLPETIEHMKSDISKAFKSKTLRLLHIILGMTIKRERKQRKLWIGHRLRLKESSRSSI